MAATRVGPAVYQTRVFSDGETVMPEPRRTTGIRPCPGAESRQAQCQLVRRVQVGRRDVDVKLLRIVQTGPARRCIVHVRPIIERQAWLTFLALGDHRHTETVMWAYRLKRYATGPRSCLSVAPPQGRLGLTVRPPARAAVSRNRDREGWRSRAGWLRLRGGSADRSALPTPWSARFRWWSISG